MREVAGLIAEVLSRPSDDGVIAAVRQKVAALAARFPLYQWKLASVRASG